MRLIVFTFLLSLSPLPLHTLSLRFPANNGYLWRRRCIMNRTHSHTVTVTQEETGYYHRVPLPMKCEMLHRPSHRSCKCIHLDTETHHHTVSLETLSPLSLSRHLWVSSPLTRRKQWRFLSLSTCTTINDSYCRSLSETSSYTIKKKLNDSIAVGSSRLSLSLGSCLNECRLKRQQVADHKSQEPVHKYIHSHSLQHSHTWVE